MHMCMRYLIPHERDLYTRQDNDAVQGMFSDWKSYYSRTYSSPQEEQAALKNFKVS